MMRDVENGPGRWKKYWSVFWEMYAAARGKKHGAMNSPRGEAVMLAGTAAHLASKAGPNPMAVLIWMGRRSMRDAEKVTEAIALALARNDLGPKVRTRWPEPPADTAADLSPLERHGGETTADLKIPSPPNE